MKNSIFTIVQLEKNEYGIIKIIFKYIKTETVLRVNIKSDLIYIIEIK